MKVNAVFIWYNNYFNWSNTFILTMQEMRIKSKISVVIYILYDVINQQGYIIL